LAKVMKKFLAPTTKLKAMFTCYDDRPIVQKDLCATSQAFTIEKGRLTGPGAGPNCPSGFVVLCPFFFDRYQALPVKADICTGENRDALDANTYNLSPFGGMWLLT
jgi:hypothetical protein